MEPLGYDNTAVQYVRQKLASLGVLGESARGDYQFNFLGVRLNTICGYRCVSCRQSQQPGRVTDEEYQELLEKYGRPGAILSISGGEPLETEESQRQTLQLVKWGKEKGMFVSLFSNLHFSEERGCGWNLIGAGLDKITTAFYSATPYQHDRFRAMSGSFERQSQALRLLADLKKVRDFELVVSLVIFRQNFSELLEMIKMAGENFPFISALDLFPIKEFEKLFLTPLQLLEFQEKVRPAAVALCEKFGFYSAARKLFEIFVPGAEEGKYGPLPPVCYSSFTSLYLDGANRLIYPCGHMVDYAERHAEPVVRARMNEEIRGKPAIFLPHYGICEKFCGPALRSYNNRTGKAVQLLLEHPSLGELMGKDNFEVEGQKWLQSRYEEMRGKKGRQFR